MLFYQETWQYEDVLDLKKVYTNDIHAMARVYGIEAAAKVIKKVFFLTLFIYKETVCQ